MTAPDYIHSVPRTSLNAGQVAVKLYVCRKAAVCCVCMERMMTEAKV